MEDLGVIRVATPVEREGKMVETSVAGEDLQRLQTAERVVGEVKRVEEQHVGDALACVNEVVAEVHHAHVQIQTQALH